MYIVKVMNEFLHGPVWIVDEDGIALESGFLPIVENDPCVAKLNADIGALFDSYYEFDVGNEACRFADERERKDKELMLGLIEQLVSRLNEINDGTYVVEDLETPRTKAL